MVLVLESGWGRVDEKGSVGASVEKVGHWQPAGSLQGWAKQFGHGAVAARGHAELLGEGRYVVPVPWWPQCPARGLARVGML